MKIYGKEYKGVYVIDCFSWFADTFAFNKKLYPTKEDAIKKFNEINPNADIESIEERLVRFCWWTEDHSHYEYPGEDVRQVCGYRTTKKGGRGAMDCWVINQDMHWERMCEE
jgi:hypothetical protein